MSAPKKHARVAGDDSEKPTNNEQFSRVFQLNADRFWSFLVTPVFPKKVASNQQDIAKPLREASKQKSHLPESVSYYAPRILSPVSILPSPRITVTE